MITPRTAADYHTAWVATARETFATHTLVSRADDRKRFVLKRNGTEQSYWVEVLVLAGGKLMVHGDIEHLLFAYYSDSRDPYDTIRWMGIHETADSYVTQKAEIGSGRALVYTTDDAVFCADVDRLRAELKGDDDTRASHKARLRALDTMQRRLKREEVSVRELIHEAYAATTWDDYGEQLCSLGQVLDTRVYMAHAALNRLWTLLSAET